MNIHFENPRGPELLARYHELCSQGRFGKAEKALEKAAMEHNYPPAIRQAALLTLNGHGKQPPDRQMAINGFRTAARLGDIPSALLLVILNFSPSTFIVYRARN